MDSDGSNPANIPGATSSAYIPNTPDLGKKVGVKLSFKDDAGNAESRTSDAFPASGTVNSVATGKPSITGTATVGQTLTAAKGTVADANGVTKADNGDAGFAYARTSGSGWTATSTASSATPRTSRGRHRAPTC